MSSFHVKVDVHKYRMFIHTSNSSISREEQEHTQQKSSGVHTTGMGSLHPASVSFMILLGCDESEELALGLVLILGRRRRRRLAVVLLTAGAVGGGEAVLPELLPHELVVDERGAPEVGERQPRDEQQLQLVPNRDPVDEGLEDHLHERDEGVEDPVGQPLLVV